MLPVVIIKDSSPICSVYLWHSPKLRMKWFHQNILKPQIKKLVDRRFWNKRTKQNSLKANHKREERKCTAPFSGKKMQLQWKDFLLILLQHLCPSPFYWHKKKWELNIENLHFIYYLLTSFPEEVYQHSSLVPAYPMIWIYWICILSLKLSLDQANPTRRSDLPFCRFQQRLTCNFLQNRRAR